MTYNSHPRQDWYKTNEEWLRKWYEISKDGKKMTFQEYVQKVWLSVEREVLSHYNG